MKQIKIFAFAGILLSLASCSKFLDIVPDNVSTIQTAFTLRESALKYLYTCYSWLPPVMNMSYDPGAGYWGGELWGIMAYNNNQAFLYAQGDQGTVDPRLNYWDGDQGGKRMFTAIRDCNIFLDNIGRVVDISGMERTRWIAEVKFLKAYYLFYLLRQYGPIPLMKENLPISVGPDEVKVFREPVDSCFNFIIDLLNQSIDSLPLTITDKAGELGRITSPIAASIKAKVLVYAASPLFNGNTDYAEFVDKKSRALFNQQYEQEKWKLAADACRQAINICANAGIELYYFQPTVGMKMSDTTVIKMSIRNSVTDPDWNSELIWGDATNIVDQAQLTPITWDPANYPTCECVISGKYGPSIEFTDIFYTNHGVPIDEDETWDYTGRFELKTAGDSDKYNISKGYTTAKLNFNRESRFYADLGFDGGIWYGQGRYNDDDTWVLEGKQGQPAGVSYIASHTPTGYYPKKLIYYENVIQKTSYSHFWYPTPRMRLADLYLLYAEALNEYYGPTDEAYQYVNNVRARAGLPTIQDSWSKYSKNPAKYTTKEGLRKIIHREREIELVFEGQNYWDQRRWKTAEESFNKPISGWDLLQADADKYYQKQFIFQLQFAKRNYLDPISELSILNNPNLVQNPGW